MTMDINKDHVEYLANTLETSPVTYRTAARDLGIHVSESKAVLSSYYRANKSRVTASFVATGTRSGGLVVRVFDSETDLTEKCNSVFDAVNTVHVYCLSSSKNSFTSVDIALEERKHSTDLSKLATYHSLGLLEGPALERTSNAKAKTGSAPGSVSSSVEPKSKHTASEERKPEPAPKAENSGNAENAEKAPEKPKLVYQSRKQQPKSSVLSNYVSRKGEKNNAGTNSGASTAQKRPAQEKPSYEYKSRKVEKSQPKERVVVSNIDAEDEDVEEIIEEVAPPNPSVTETELNNLFLDDFTDEDEKDAGNQDMEIDQPILVDQADPETNDEEANKEAEETQKEQKEQLPKDDIWTSMSSKSPAPESAVEKQNSPVPETTVDEDGYFTSYKKSEPKAEPVKKKPLRQPPPKTTKPSKKSDGKLKQTSLMSFFGKK